MNGYEAIFGFAFDTDFKNVLFPAFGKPTSPISAMIFRSNVIFLIFPLAPIKLFPVHPPTPENLI